MERRLTPDETALWRRVMATVRPAVRPVPAVQTLAPAPVAVANPKKAAPVAATSKPRASAFPAQATLLRPPVKPGVTLDGSWDRKLATGAIAPDSSIDLHDHNLESAYAVLDRGLDRAIRRGDRVLLLITGKPPRPESERPHARGRIRAAVGDWLAASRHAGQIAAVRGAHPRHGGAGALYIVLRRHRSERVY